MVTLSFCSRSGNPGAAGAEQTCCGPTPGPAEFRAAFKPIKQPANRRRSSTAMEKRSETDKAGDSALQRRPGHQVQVGLEHKYLFLSLLCFIIYSFRPGRYNYCLTSLTNVQMSGKKTRQQFFLFFFCYGHKIENVKLKCFLHVRVLKAVKKRLSGLNGFVFFFGFFSNLLLPTWPRLERKLKKCSCIH